MLLPTFQSAVWCLAWLRHVSLVATDLFLDAFCTVVHVAGVVFLVHSNRRGAPFTNIHGRRDSERIRQTPAGCKSNPTKQYERIEETEIRGPRALSM
jgi:hypothetical protein